MITELFPREEIYETKTSNLCSLSVSYNFSPIIEKEWRFTFKDGHTNYDNQIHN